MDGLDQVSGFMACPRMPIVVLCWIAMAALLSPMKAFRSYQYIETGVTHIVLSDEPLTWTESRLTETRREGLEQAFSSWKVAWENKDNPVYLGFYAGDFSDFIRNKTQWDEYKTRVNNGKRWISVETSNVSFFTDLKQPDMVTIRYYQDYRSSNYNWRGWKEQLWRETDSGWQIVYEGNG